MIFELIVTVGMAGKREPIAEFADLTECRQRAHAHVSDPRPFDPQLSLFMSPSGQSKAYCRPKGQ